MADLLPCPFCGGNDVTVLGPTCTKRTPYDPSHRAFPIARCRCGTWASGTDWDQVGTSAVERWNTRAPAVVVSAEPVAWKSLTDREWVNVVNSNEVKEEGSDVHMAVCAAFKLIEAKLREKNERHLATPVGPDAVDARDVQIAELRSALQQCFDYPADVFDMDAGESFTMTVQGFHLHLVKAALASTPSKGAA